MENEEQHKKLTEVINKYAAANDDAFHLLCEFVVRYRLADDLESFAILRKEEMAEVAAHRNEIINDKGPCCQCGDDAHTCDTCPGFVQGGV